MSLRKFCTPTECPASPSCDHHWFYDFRVNRRRYRNTTETANKQLAKQIEARERAKILEGRHGIRQQPDITFKEFSKTYLNDHAELNKRTSTVNRDGEALKAANRAFGSVLLHEITSHRIEQYKRERLAGRWGEGKPLAPATVNRELDTLRSIFSKAVEWRQLRG
jgi:hypothetical protein